MLNPLKRYMNAPYVSYVRTLHEHTLKYRCYELDQLPTTSSDRPPSIPSPVQLCTPPIPCVNEANGCATVIVQTGQMYVAHAK
eukprot:17647-Heterococcus_DN1.PRE.2